MPQAADTTVIIEFLTGVAPEGDVRGRNVWGKVPYRGHPGALHVEVTPEHPEAMNEAMQSICEAEMALGQAERRKLYRSRCVATAHRINRLAVDGGNLKLLVSSNGHLTSAAKAALELLGYPK